jgi:hypothetical protein
MSVSARLTEVMDSRPSMIVTSDQIAQFRSAGFVSFPRLIDGGTLDTLRAAYDELIEVGARGDGSLDRRLGDSHARSCDPSARTPHSTTTIPLVPRH